MYGIAGVINETGQPRARATAVRLGQGLSGRNPVRSSVNIAGAGNCAMAYSAAKGPSPHHVACDADGNVLGVEGEVLGLWNPPPALAQVDARELRRDPAAVLLRCFGLVGPNLVRYLRGAFALAIWEAGPRRLHLMTDRHGLRPLYYRALPRQVLFASRVRALLAHEGCTWEPDEHGIADYLILGYPLGTRTLFRDVSLVPPGSVVTMERGTSRPSTYWQHTFASGDQVGLDADALASEMTSALIGATRLMTEECDVVEVPLSGGLDSRCLAALTHYLGVPMRTYTVGTANRADLSLGPVIARTLRVPNTSWALTSADFLDWIEDSVYLTDGMCNPIDAPIIHIARRLPSDARVVLDGTNSFDGPYMYFEPALRRLRDRNLSVERLSPKLLACPVLDDDQEPSSPYLRLDYLRRAAPLIESSLSDFHASVHRTPGSNPYDLFDSLVQRYRVPRYNMMGSVLLRAFCEVRHPFYDPAVLDVATRLHRVLRAREKRVQGRVLRVLAPEVARITYERTGLRADAGLALHSLGYGVKFARYALGRSVPALRPTPHNAIDYAGWMRSDGALQRYFRDTLLSDRTLDRGYTTREQSQRLLDDLFSGREKVLPLACRMLALELWRRRFVEGDRPASEPTLARPRPFPQAATA